MGEKSNVAVDESVGFAGADVIWMVPVVDASRELRATTPTLLRLVGLVLASFVFEGLAASAPGDAA